MERHSVHATLDRGNLTGSPALVVTVEAMVRNRARVSLPGIITGEATLEDDLLARATLLGACDHGTGLLSGDPPRLRSPLPLGAQA